MLAGEVGPSGYLVAYALAEANLVLRPDVVADSVNPLAVAQSAWRRVAANGSSPCVEIELVCSDPVGTAAGWKRGRPVSRGCASQAGTTCGNAPTTHGTGRAWSWTRQGAASRTWQPNSTAGSPTHPTDSDRAAAAPSRHQKCIVAKEFEKCV